MSSEPLSPEDAERLARENARDPEPEVRPDEFTAGIGELVGGSPFSDEVVAELRKPLDPNRIRRREGRGNTSLEYLAGHDVIREANRIFGFGRWGTEVVELVELDAVAVRSRGDTPKDGWHVGYRCTVRLVVAGAVPVTGIGYGDGVEYTPAARVQACELAIKEAETDAIKRAFTKLGDQFGLILYAKADEKRRITRDQDVADTGSSRETVRREPDGPSIPRSWGEVEQRFAALLGGEHAREEFGHWLRQAIQQRWGCPYEQLKTGENREALQLAASVLVALEADHGDLAFAPDPRGVVAAAWASRWGGIALEGPPWALSATETDRPSYADAHTSAA